METLRRLVSNRGGFIGEHSLPFDGPSSAGPSPIPSSATILEPDLPALGLAGGVVVARLRRRIGAENWPGGSGVVVRLRLLPEEEAVELILSRRREGYLCAFGGR